MQGAEGDGPRWIDVRISDGRAALQGRLALPRDARGMVVFAHGTGSGRHSRRNRRVAEALNGAAYATLLFDLLTEAESDDRLKAFDVSLLSERLVHATHWLAEHRATGDLPVGYLGGSTGAAAALAAASALGTAVRAVVSRGGRPDLVEPETLRLVRAPVLFVVGERDETVLKLNRQAMESIHAPKELVVVPGATHLFEEPGALDEVARLAVDWFGRHLRPARPGGNGA